MNNYAKEFLDGNLILCPKGNEELMYDFLCEANIDIDKESGALKRAIKVYKDKASFRFSERLHYAPKQYYEDSGHTVLDLDALSISKNESIDENEILVLFKDSL